MLRAAVSIARVLEDLARAFRTLSVPWYVFGAQALVLRGCPRATADLDVTVLAGKLPTTRLVKTLADCGLLPRIRDEDFIVATRVLPAIHVRSSLPVDIVLGAAGLEELFARAAQPMRVGRANVPVATVTHLVLMKVLASRPKDLQDAATLLALRSSEVDESELNDLARKMASALAEDSILRHLEEARQLAKRLGIAKSRSVTQRTKTPRTKTPRRN